MFESYVIIPVYNAEKYLDKAVRSILSQPCQVTRILLVDDGATDGSAKICDDFADQHDNICVIHQQNCGVSAARNVGIKHLIESGVSVDSYVAFLDADDLWYPSFLNETLVKHIDETRYDMYAFGMASCDESMLYFSQPSVYENAVSEGGIKAIWSVRNHFAANLYRMSLFKNWNIRFFEGCKYSEDKYFKMQCAFFADTLEFLPDLQYLYRQIMAGAMGQSKTITPIDYYLPIVNGWLQSDDFINSWAPVTGRTICAGHTLASVYLLDMAREHYMQWRPGKEIRQAVENHPHYVHLKSLRALDSNDKNHKDKEWFVNHHAVFAWKYRLIGIGYYCLRAMLRIPFIRKLNDKRKFPLDQMP